MRFSLLSSALAVALSGCQQQGPIGQIQGRLIPSPSLLDVGVAPVGVPTTFQVQLDADDADVEVINISVLNLEGTYFGVPDAIEVIADTGSDAGITETSTDFVVKVDESRQVDLLYYPLQEGYHRARVTFTTKSQRADFREVSIDVRGQADTPDALVFPWTLDFGAVPVGQTGIKRLEVANQSELELAITSLSFEDPQFSSPEALPIIVAPQANYKLDIHFDPLIDDALLSGMVVLTGQEPLQRVLLRANDCENGVPSAYDVDGDGFTTCGGDCDDSNPTVRPGAVEVANGRDDDCNDLTDDRTDVYDDDGDGYTESDFPPDCNDGDIDVHPGNVENCPGDDDNCFDGVDNDCDGVTDGGTEDLDGDGYTAAAGDCDIHDSRRYPGAQEIPDRLDNDCDGIADEGTVLYDDDGDGYCEGKSGFMGCTVGIGEDDCDDSYDEDNPSGPHAGAVTHPFADEVADWRDNNCNGLVDEGTVNADDDGDGYTERAVPPDCNDANPSVGPHMREIPGNGVDDDCNPATPPTGTQ